MQGFEKLVGFTWSPPLPPAPRSHTPLRIRISRLLSESLIHHRNSSRSLTGTKQHGASAVVLRDTPAKDKTIRGVINLLETIMSRLLSIASCVCSLAALINLFFGLWLFDTEAIDDLALVFTCVFAWLFLSGVYLILARLVEGERHVSH